MEQIARTPKQLGDALRRHRRAQGYNQSSVGGMTRLRQATISTLEAGEPGTQLRTVFDVLASLGLELVVRPRTQASANDIEDLF